MQVERLADGLWWWTGRVDGRDLGSLYVESAAAISLLDPVLPPEDTERFLRALDRDVERHGGPVDVFVSTPARRELASVLIERYGATVRDASTADVELRDGGRAFWLPAHRRLFSDGAVASR